MRGHYSWPRFTQQELNATLRGDKRNVHTLRSREVILAYMWVNSKFMLAEIAYLWPIKHTLYICFNYSRKGHTDQKKRMSVLKIKCFSFQGTAAGDSLMIKLHPRCQGHANLLHTWCMLICVVWGFVLFCFLKPWRNGSLTCLMLFVITRYKTLLEIMLLSRAASQNKLGAGFWASSQFGPNKTLCWS